MIDFVEPAKPFKPFTLSFWERQYGSEIPAFEFNRIKEFYNAKQAKRANVSGYVKKVGSQRFLLLPTLHNPTYLLCICAEGVKVPPENSYVNVEGQIRWSQLKISSDGTYGNNSDKEIIVEQWLPDTPDWQNKIESNMDFKEFKEEVFASFSNIEPLVQNFIASQIVGCPKYDGFFGGLNLCLYDSTQNALATTLAKEIRRIVPRDIGKPHTIKTPYGNVPLRCNYNLVTIDADTKLSPKVKLAMEKRIANIGYDEFSLYFGSKKNLPKTLEEPPFQLSDFPTTLNEEVEYLKKRADPSLDAFKYMQIQHYIAPIITNTSDMIDKVQETLVKLPERYDVSPQLLARFKFLDASYYGKPQSVMRLALTKTRTENLEKINDNNIKDAIQMFEENFDYNFELWRDMFPKESLGAGTDILLKRSPDERKILRIIDKLQGTKEKCVSINEISEGIPRLKKEMLEELLEELSKRGLIIEKRYHCYSLISF
ncbi:MAG: hypothetical protein IAX21_08890 [Candidatus Bathyarchaeota archaeon]|nr:MAG: hypothetical protein IAX21_08890 [Candidatus Bathyarchaeota archaeon]